MAIVLEREVIEEFLLESLADLLEVPATELATDVAFDRYGIDSASVVELTAKLQTLVGRKLDATLLYDHPTIETLSTYLASDGE
ncbi:acyl carrier protein [Pseudomonas fluorescens]|uniref:Phosphopantetheine-binding protein n=1 Tax=Pseudomonas fluorescens TaxID=294 RepID=A0A2N1DXG4_PSEFL|nr:MULTISPECIES: acyl carrier protein [Pseudomonas]RYF63868.1 MAG: acyl carrier protein [Cytophagaceae bacterium]MBD8100189.1 acyl carrier protein [Pseudomonas fluorescens]MBD8776808.1 acyl carrier protein [Pseudomonas fluorescens]MBD8781849.1 acyl carrier protein [Pseudomonas fluorescens]MBD8798399.1 acyl carrier protein [Pseudomonas fluorescens]